MADKDPRHIDREAEEKRQSGIQDAVAKSNIEYAKLGLQPDGTRSVPSSPPPEKDRK